MEVSTFHSNNGDDSIQIDTGDSTHVKVFLNDFLLYEGDPDKDDASLTADDVISLAWCLEAINNRAKVIMLREGEEKIYLLRGLSRDDTDDVRRALVRLYDVATYNGTEVPLRDLAQLRSWGEITIFHDTPKEARADLPTT